MKDINRIKVVLVEKKKTSKWLAGELGKDPATICPYSAAFTTGSFVMYETIRMLPLFLAENSEELIKQEIENNKYMMVNSIVSRKRYISELKRRFNAVPRSFWEMTYEYN